MAGDALVGEPAPEAAVVFLETGRHVPALFLRVPGDGRLIDVTVDVEDMRVGMLPGANDIADFFEAVVDCVAVFTEAVFEDIHDRILEKGVVVEIAERIKNDGMWAEFGGGFLQGRMVKGAAHACVDEGVVDVFVATGAGGHSHVGYAVPDVSEGGVGGGGACFFAKGKAPCQ